MNLKTFVRRSQAGQALDDRTEERASFLVESNLAVECFDSCVFQCDELLAKIASEVDRRLMPFAFRVSFVSSSDAVAGFNAPDHGVDRQALMKSHQRRRFFFAWPPVRRSML